MNAPKRTRDARNWRDLVTPFEHADARRAWRQVEATLGLLAVGLYCTYRSLALPYWVTLLLALPTAAFLIRTFMLMHDCAHGSLFPSRRANEVLGFIAGVLTLTPFAQWRRDHVLHHASAGDLDRRGHGDVLTLTVREYLARSWWGRLKYRLYRHPLVMLGLGPLHLAVGQRWRQRSAATGDKEIASVRVTNTALVALIVGWWLVIGVKALLLVYAPVFMMAGAGGIWLFYVQHQFEGTSWQPHATWDYAAAALNGSSYIRLPPLLQWVTCSIGLHHLHHLSPRVPNYRLQACHDANPAFHQVPMVTLRASVRAFSLKLWDEDLARLVDFRTAHARESNCC
jgi:omega-6 fatty acid desaturase (delta-12 desaturase)